MDATPKTSLHPTPTSAEEVYRLSGCSASYRITGFIDMSTVVRNNCCAGEFDDVLSRLGVSMRINGEDVPVPARRFGNQRGGLRSRCVLEVTRLGIGIEGYFFGEDIYFFAVLCSRVLKVFSEHAPSLSGARSEMSYYVNVVIGESETLVDRLKNSPAWKRQNSSTFTVRDMVDASTFVETIVKVSQNRLQFRTNLLHRGVLEPVDAIEETERLFLERLESMGLPIIVLPLA